MSARGIGALCELTTLRARRTHGHRNFLVPNFPQKPIGQCRPGLCISEGRTYPENLELRAAQGKCNRERVIDIVANISVNDDLFRRIRRCTLRNSRGRKQQKGTDGTEQNPDMPQNSMELRVNYMTPRAKVFQNSAERSSTPLN